MEIVGAIFSLLGPIAVIIVIVSLVRRRKHEEVETGIGSTRRIFLYGLGFVAAMVTGVGLTTLLASFLASFGTGPIIDEGGAGSIAFGLSATVVSFPIWVLLWRASTKSLMTYPSESGTLGRKTYIYLTLSIAACVTVVNLVQMLRQALSGFEDFAIADIATPLIWGLIWTFHWRIESAEGQPSDIAISVRNLYVYHVALYGIVMFAIGSGLMIYGLLDNVYANAFEANLVGKGIGDLWDDRAQMAVAIGLVGALFWGMHWVRFARKEHPSMLRVAVIYVVGIFGGIVASISGIAVIMFGLFEWVLGNKLESISSHFDSIPSAMAISITGIAIWTYFKRVSQQDMDMGTIRLESGERAYRYLSSGVGLATLGIGIAILFGSIISMILTPSKSFLTNATSDSTAISFALTALFIGGAIWSLQWLKRQRGAEAEDAQERATQSRRIYMFSVFGIAVLVTLIAATIILFGFIRSTLEGTFTLSTISNLEFTIGALGSAAVIGWYHWQILREDRAIDEAVGHEMRRETTPTKNIIAIAPEADRSTIESIRNISKAQITQYYVRQDQTEGSFLGEGEVSAIVDHIARTTSVQVILVISKDKTEVIPL